MEIEKDEILMSKKTTKYMEKVFDYFNQRYFGSILPHPTFCFNITPSSYGYCKYNYNNGECMIGINIIPVFKYRPLFSFWLHVYSIFPFLLHPVVRKHQPNDFFFEVLVHEMSHYYIDSTFGYKKLHHPNIFIDKMKEIGIKVIRLKNRDTSNTVIEGSDFDNFLKDHPRYLDRCTRKILKEKKKIRKLIKKGKIDKILSKERKCH